MEFTVQKEALVDGIQVVQNAITQKSSLPILANVLLEVTPSQVTLTATDLDIGISAKVPLLAGDNGAITVPAKKFFDISKSLPDGSDINIAIKKNNSTTIQAGKAMFKIIGLPKEDFPELPIFEDKESIQIGQENLKKMIALADFSISRDDARHILTGILIEVKEDKITLVATDGRRMSVVKSKLDKRKLTERKVVVPIKAIQEVKRLLSDEDEVTIKFGEKQIVFSFKGYFIISRLIEGDYPDYDKVIPPRSEKIVKAEREKLLSALKRVSILTDQDSQAVKIKIQKKKMTISKNTPYLGEAKEEINIEFNDEKEVEIGFNPRYLIDVLKSIKGDEVEIEVGDYNKPGVIREENFIYVVLPMQLAK